MQIREFNRGSGRTVYGGKLRVLSTFFEITLNSPRSMTEFFNVNESNAAMIFK